MDKIFTQDDILLYIYDEMPSKLKEEFELALSHNSKLMETYQELKQNTEFLNEAVVSPSPTSVKIILEQSHDSPTLEPQ